MFRFVGITGKCGSGKSTAASLLAAILAGTGREQVVKVRAIAEPLKALCSAAYDYPYDLNYEEGGKRVVPPWAAGAEADTPLITMSSFLETLTEGYRSAACPSDLEAELRRINESIAKKFGTIRGQGRPITVGRILQTVGQTFRDEIGEDAWLNLFFENLQKEVRYAGKAEVVVVEDVRYENEAEALTAYGAKLLRVERATGCPPSGRDDDHPSETGVGNFRGSGGVLVLKNSEDMRILGAQLQKLVDDGLI
jgi:energy-coupling factor transporter ATP-binding protein EcfA2